MLRGELLVAWSDWGSICINPVIQNADHLGMVNPTGHNWMAIQVINFSPVNPTGVDPGPISLEPRSIEHFVHEELVGGCLMIRYLEVSRGYPKRMVYDGKSQENMISGY